MKKSTEQIAGKANAFLPGWYPIEKLWSEEKSPFDEPPYVSEGAAQWRLRLMRPELIQAGALLRFSGKLMFHADRFSQVAAEFEVKRYAAGYGAAAGQKIESRAVHTS